MLIVIDASVVVKLIFEEPDSAIAEQYLAQEENRFIAPDHMPTEVANVIWKRRRSGDLTDEQASGALDVLFSLPIESVPSSGLLPASLGIAITTGRTVYDSLYIGLAVREECAALTADERLVNALRNTSFSKHVRRLGE